MDTGDRCAATDGASLSKIERPLATSLGESLPEREFNLIGKLQMCQKPSYCKCAVLVLVQFLLITVASADGKEIKVFLLGGQSNMSGRADSDALAALTDGLDSPQADVLFYHDTDRDTDLAKKTVVSLQPGSGVYTPADPDTSGFGPEVTFGRAIADAYQNESFALIKYAVGGTNLYDDWDPDTGSEYTAFKSTITEGLAALALAGDEGDTFKIVGMLWHQGESDSTAAQSGNYEANLTDLIAEVRVEYGENLPFFVGEINNSGIYRDNVIQGMKNVATADPYTEFISADDLLTGLHFEAPGMVILGQRYAEAVNLPEPDAAGTMCTAACGLLMLGRFRGIGRSRRIGE